MAYRASTGLTWDQKQIEGMTQKAITAGLRQAAQHGRKRIKAKLTSGGSSVPGVDTGMLRRSVQYRVKSRKGRFVVVDVGVLRPSSNDSKARGKSFPGRMHAQALRLARGYTGRDRLGRYYSQRPRPFVEPVLNAEKETMARIVRTTAENWMPKPKERG